MVDETDGFKENESDDSAENAEEYSPIAELSHLKMIEDIPLVLSVEFGRTHIPVRRFLELKEQSVLALDKLAGEPIEVLLNGRLIARGEALIVNERFGVRLTDIVTQKDILD